MACLYFNHGVTTPIFSIDMIVLRVLGTFSALDDERPITALRSSRARALLVYLAVESRTPLWREKLATLLWSNMSDERARRNLSLTLTRLHQALDSHTPNVAAQLVKTTPQTLHLPPTPHLWCDVQEFEDYLNAVATHTHLHLHTCTACLTHLETALGLYQGEFLEGFSVEDMPLFEEWCTRTRESYHQKALGALHILTESALERQEYERAYGFAQRQLALEPWLEQAHYQAMVALMHEGQRSKALQQYKVCCAQMAEEFGVAPSEKIQALYARLQIGAEVASAELYSHSESAPLGIHTLPLAPNRFFGREAEQARLKTLLTDDDTRLVTVLGSGGIGKTRLATKVGYTLRDSFPDGVWFVSLVGVEAQSEKEARETLTRAIYTVLPITTNASASEQHLFAVLRTQRLLLILDNMEQLCEGAALVGDLLRAAPYLTVLCTSRAPLKLRVEWLFPIEGLPVHPHHPSEHHQDTSASLQLFVARACQALPTFTITAENQVAVLAICTITNGNPLGIELAAAMLRYRAPHILAVDLEQSLDALYSEQRDVEVRHRSLRAIFTSSWELLRPEEQRVLAQLSLFRAPFTLENATAITGTASAHLDALIDQSLLAPSEQGRYELHTLVREYATERLVASGEYDSTYTRYRYYFLESLHTHYPTLLGMEPRAAMEILYACMEDIRIAWSDTIARGEIKLLSRALPPLARYLVMLNLGGSGGIVFDQDALHITHTVGDANNETMALIGALWVAAAQTSLRRAPLDLLMEAGQTIRDIGQRVDSRVLEAHGWRVQGSAQLAKGSSKQSLFYLDRALAIARSSDDSQLLMACLAAYGTPLESQRTHAEEALTLATALGDGWTIALLHINLGGAYYLDGDFVQVREAFRHAIRYYEQSGQRRQLAIMLNNVGDVHRVLGQYEQAYSFHRAGLEIAQQIGDRWSEQSIMDGMARYYRDIGDLATARKLVEKSIVMVIAMDVTTEVSNHYNTLGLIALEQGQWEEAERAFTEAIRLSSAGEHHYVLMESYAGMARIEQAWGQKKHAVPWVEVIADYIVAGHQLGSYNDAPFIYWTCYELLKLVQDPRARLVLERAYARFEGTAATLPTTQEVTLFWSIPLRARIREEALCQTPPASSRLYRVPKVS